jgi:amino acid transporter/mannitol/fructose-specific phosphotransferase system IIA component (Ntr-type)
MISSGLFILPGIAFARTGPSVVAAYLLAGLLALAGMLCQAELVSAMPKTGGTYFFVMRSMGPAIGTVNGLTTWLSLSLKSAFALVGMAAFVHPFIPLDIRLIAIPLTSFFVVLNITGVKRAGQYQSVMVIALLLLLVYFVLRGLPAVNVHRFQPFATGGLMAVAATAGFVFISYGGLLKVAAIAEEVNQPAKTVPSAMLIALCSVSLLYVLVVFVTVGVMQPDSLAVSLTPITDAASAFLTRPGVLLVSVAAILAFVSTANAGIMAASRYPVALAQDGLLPHAFALTSKRFGTPWVSILCTGALASAALLVDLSFLVKAASSVLILSFLFSCLCVIIMREGHVQNYRPQFRSPAYPWLPALGCVGYILLLFVMGKDALVVVLFLAAAGAFAWWFSGRVKETREYALLHLIERITARELTEHLLETELKEIVRERDAIVADRFDRLVDNAAVIDMPSPATSETLFEEVAKVLAPRLGMEQGTLRALLRAREEESSTVITPGLAIPHVIVDGSNHFDLLLARNRHGITFAGANAPVNAVFVLAGSRDERNFHLRALAAIAQIVQSPDFMQRWDQARGDRALRDIVLLAKRMRQAPPRLTESKDGLAP